MARTSPSDTISRVRKTIVRAWFRSEPEYTSVLDFRKALKHREGIGRREHRPLLMLILLLGILAMVADNLRRPSLWAMLDRAANPSPEPPAIGDRHPLAPPREAPPPDSFVMASDRPEEQPAAQDDGDFFPGVEPSQLRPIRDDRPSLPAERTCSLRLLKILKQADLAELRRASMGPITYAQLYNQPENYRGRLVTLAGVVRRVEPVELPTNDYGISSYHQVWLFPNDNPSSPEVVYCLDLPKGFPTGTELAVDAGVTAFFFKRWAYSTPDADRIAPLLLAKTLHWWKEPVVTPEPAARPQWLPLVVIFAALAAMYAAWYASLRPRPSRVPLPERPPDFTRLRLDGKTGESPGTEKGKEP
jgi:hypothetical protein